MSKKTSEKPKINSKKSILQEITFQLSQALTTLKDSLGEKKFDKRIKKAAKLLSEGIKPATPEKKPATSKAADAKPKPAKAKAPIPARKRTKPVAAK